MIRKNIQSKNEELISMLENFIENAPTLSKQTKIVNRQDPTAWRKISCDIYIGEFEFNKGNGFWPEIKKYQVSVTQCFDCTIDIVELDPEDDRPRKITYTASLGDEGWIPAAISTDPKVMENCIMLILKEGKYNIVEECDDPMGNPADYI